MPITNAKIIGVKVNNAATSQSETSATVETITEMVDEKIITIECPPFPLYDSLVKNNWVYPETPDAYVPRVTLSIKPSSQVDNYALASLILHDVSGVATDAKSIGFSTSYPGYASFKELCAQEREKFIIRLLAGE